MFKDKCLLPKESYYTLLSNKHIADTDHDHTERVFDSPNCQNNQYGDYHNLYLLSAVLCLGYVLENSRKVCLKAYNFDSCHFYTSSGLAWQACLKMTNVGLEVLTNPDVYLVIKEGLHGEISMICNLFSKTNNLHVPDYGPKQETSNVIYLDVNDLYA